MTDSLATIDSLAARRLVIDLLAGVLDRGVALDTGFAVFTGEGGRYRALDTRDRAFARRLAATVLRRLGQIDAVIGHFIDRPLSRDARPARHLLRLGAAQILFTGTAHHAAVDTTVTLAARHHRSAVRGKKGLINAVLRRIAAKGGALLDTECADLALNLPSWLAESWQQTWGNDSLAAIMGVLASDPMVDFSLRDERSGDRWAQALAAQVLPTGSLRRPGGGRIEDLPGYSEGAWWVQDAAAALPARLFGNVAGQAVLDLCAAPGGKTAQLAALGARVAAVDRSPARLARLRSNLDRLGLTATFVEADATEWRGDGGVWSSILLDAPCSATGTLHRHPDIGWLKKPGDVAKLAAVQRRMLDHAAGLLAPGGRLVYCTCSLQPAEGEDQIEAFLKRHPDMTVEPLGLDEIGLAAPAPAPALVDRFGAIRTLPCHFASLGGIDGFYIARLLKRP